MYSRMLCVDFALYWKCWSTNSSTLSSTAGVPPGVFVGPLPWCQNLKHLRQQQPGVKLKKQTNKKKTWSCPSQHRGCGESPASCSQDALFFDEAKESQPPIKAVCQLYRCISVELPDKLQTAWCSSCTEADKKPCSLLWKQLRTLFPLCCHQYKHWGLGAENTIKKTPLHANWASSVEIPPIGQSPQIYPHIHIHID